MTNWFTSFREGSRGSGMEDFPAEEKLNAFREFLGISQTESLIIAWLCMNYKKSEGKSINRLFEKLSDKVPDNKIEDAFTNLVASGLVQLNTDDYNQSSHSIVFTHRVEVALRTGCNEVFKQKVKNQQSDDRLTLRIYAHAVLFRSKMKDADAWLSTCKFFLHYFDSEILNITRGAKLDRFTKAVLLYIYVMHAVEGSGAEYRFLSLLFSENKMQARRLLFEWKKPEWKPIQTGLLEIRQHPMGPPLLVPSEWVQQKIYGPESNKMKVLEYLPSSLQIIPTKVIKARKLCYNPNESEQIELLQKILMPENFKKFQRVNYQKGRSCGITVLLSGGPGTGKTELARQAARATGRDLIMFQVAEQRDKYFGESEKRIKEVFEAYDEIIYSGRRAPILFFNEADSVFHMRSSNESSTSKTENAVQTILLNELEQFKGILICTTNRADSFDAAFSRRFDFKITIHPPTTDVRLQLLKQGCKPIPFDRMVSLAEQYPFTGAELENFHKMYAMQSIVKKGGLHKDMGSALEEYLATIFNKRVSAIGFRTNQHVMNTP
jgi:hypothetical protein